MKTAISLPDELFAAAEKLAERLGVSRSQLYATALAEHYRFLSFGDAMLLSRPSGVGEGPR